MYSLNEFYEILENFKGKNVEIKITKILKNDFNDMEGYQFYINVKITLLDEKKVFADTKRKSKMFKIHTNSTYIENFEHETETELIETLLGWLYTATMQW